MGPGRHSVADLIALPVALAVKGRRAATTSTLAGPVGLLVLAFGDGVRDAAGPQGGPVDPAAVSLVPGQMIRSHPGPRPPRRATRTASTRTTSSQVSAPCPGVSRVARLRPRPSPTVCTLVVSPPVTAPALAGGLPGSARSTFPAPAACWWGPDDAGVDLGVPVQLPSPVGLGPQGGLDPGPGPVGLPAREPLGDRLPGPIALGKVPPRHPAAHPEQDAVEDLAVVPPTPTPLGRHRWQQRCRPLPLVIGDLESSVHGQLLPHHLHPTQTHHRSEKHALGPCRLNEPGSRVPTCPRSNARRLASQPGSGLERILISKCREPPC